MIYYGSRISDNLSETPEGFLICHNVPIARTGYQDYLGSELIDCFPDAQKEFGIEPSKAYKVYRSADEVFSPATIASFEGKPFTDNHPSEMVDTQNIDLYGKGHIQNIHRGTGEYRDMLIADIICTDESVANEIKHKLKREVSCGYDLVIKKGPKGFEQTQIRGNHLALVENGRAGQKAAIQDQMPDAIIKKSQKEGETNTMKNFISKMFAAWAKDAEPAEIEQALNEMGHDSDPAAPAPAPAPASNTEKDIAELKTAMSEVMATLKQLVESDKQVHQEVSDEDKLNELEKTCTDSLEDPDEGEDFTKEDPQLIEDESAEVDPEEVEKSLTTDAAIGAVIKAMRPKLLAIEDEKARGQVVDAFVAAVNDARTVKAPAKDDYAALIRAAKAHSVAKDTAAKPKTIDERRAEQVNAINKFNPHAKKEEK